MTDFLWSLGVWNWFIVAVALFVLETIVPGVHFIWFGLAAAIVGILGLVVDIPWEWQLIAFAIISCITVFFARRLLRRLSRAQMSPTSICARLSTLAAS